MLKYTLESNLTEKEWLKMFKKLVSNLPFSPSLIGQLGFYAARLRKEQWMRKLGLIFTVFALVIQSFAVFNPPQSANASSANDIISGGCATKQCILSAYDSNRQGFRDLMSHYGITRAELNAARWRAPNQTGWYINGNDYQYSFGRQNYNCRSGSVTIGKYKYYYGSYSACWGRNVWLPGMDGYSARAGAFAINAFCSNLLLKKLPPAPTPKPQPQPKCKIPGKTHLNANDPKCKAPSATCTQLSTQPATGISGKTEFTFKVSGKLANDAKWKSYSIKYSSDNGKTWKNGVSHALNANGSGGAYGTGAAWKNIFKNPGKYQIRGYLNTTNAGSNITSNTCVKSITVKPAPTANCKSLTVKQISRTKFQLNGTASVANGATVKSYKYVVKDAKGKIVYDKTFNSSKTTDSRSIDLPDNTSLVDKSQFAATLTVSTSVGNKTNGTTCAKPIQISPKDKCAYNPEIAEDDKDCKPKCEYNDEIFADDEDCKPKCEYNDEIFADDEDCKPPNCTTEEDKAKPECQPDIAIRKTSTNNTQGGVDATQTIANAGDSITYTIEITNNGAVAGSIDVNDPLHDVLEYARLVDYGGGNFDQQSEALTWSNVNVPAGQTITRNLTVVINNPIESKAQGQSLPSSFDCRITNTINNDPDTAIDININCPAPKVVEQVVRQLPATGAGTNIIVGGSIAAIVVFFYARTKQLNKEVRLIRKEYAAGSL